MTKFLVRLRALVIMTLMMMILSPIVMAQQHEEEEESAQQQQQGLLRHGRRRDLGDRTNLGNGDEDLDGTEPRIVGGSNANPLDYPYFVFDGGCGGTVIGADLILTAGHCLPMNDVRVEATGDWYSVVDQIRHPQYGSTGETSRWDFALLRLAQPIPNAQPVTLNFNSGSPSSGQMLTVIGRGRLFQNGPLPDRLQEVDVPAVSTNTCNFEGGYGSSVNDVNMFCAGFLAGGFDSCQGDSGGPIVIKNGGNHVQVGVTSWGVGCAEPDFPGVYARISAAEDWIKEEGCDLASSNNSPSFCDSSNSGMDLPAFSLAALLGACL